MQLIWQLQLQSTGTRSSYCLTGKRAPKQSCLTLHMFMHKFSAPFCGRTLKAGETNPILKPHVLKDELKRVAEECKAPTLLDSAIAKQLEWCQEVGPCASSVLLIGGMHFVHCSPIPADKQALA